MWSADKAARVNNICSICLVGWLVYLFRGAENRATSPLIDHPAAVKASAAAFREAKRARCCNPFDKSPSGWIVSETKREGDCGAIASP